MSLLYALLGFTAAASALTVTPGVDNAMVLRSAATSGPRAGAAAACGICLGVLLWGVGAASGLTLLLAASETAFAIVKFCGAAYLVWLGIGMLRGRQGLVASAPGHGSAFRRAFAGNMLNPKVGVFYVTFLPQFIPQGVDVARFSLLLTLVNVALEAAWFAALIAFTVPLGRALARPAVKRTLDRVTGCVLVGFGLRLALPGKG